MKIAYEVSDGGQTKLNERDPNFLQRFDKIQAMADRAEGWFDMHNFQIMKLMIDDIPSVWVTIDREVLSSKRSRFTTWANQLKCNVNWKSTLEVRIWL